MWLSRITIKNFRNFKLLDVKLGEHAVVLRENKVGKSNLLFALRLILDPSLPDSARRLRFDDFWDGLSRPLATEDVIEISPEFRGFRRGGRCACTAVFSTGQRLANHYVSDTI
jgi:putative ATP-dependent endonuclease of the OLD family